MVKIISSERDMYKLSEDRDCEFQHLPDHRKLEVIHMLLKKQEETTQFLEGISFHLGFAHMSISMILEKPDAELRDQLSLLKQELDKRVSKLYYNEDVQ